MPWFDLFLCLTLHDASLLTHTYTGFIPQKQDPEYCTDDQTDSSIAHGLARGAIDGAIGP